MHKGFLNVGLLLAVGISIFNAPVARALDVTVGPMHWYYPEDEGGQVPYTKRPLQVEYPDRLKGSDEIYYIILNQKLNRKGEHVLVSSPECRSDDLLRGAALFANRDAKFTPARRDNQDVDSHVWNAVIFNPASAALKKPVATARLLEVWPAFVPAPTDRGEELPQTWANIRVSTEGRATLLSFESGQTSANDVAQAARAAVAKWKFAPARKDGKAVESEVELPVVLLPVEPPENRSDWPPEVIQKGKRGYPFSMRAAGLRGEVMVFIVVSKDGTVMQATVLASNDPRLDKPAIDGVSKLKFKPARRRGQPVNARFMRKIVFPGLDTPAGGQDALTVEKGDLSKQPPEFLFDQPPKLVNVAYVVYPSELLEKGIGGETKINFVVDQSGHVAGQLVVSSTRPEFTQAVMAMLDACVFDPARKNGKPTLATVSLGHKFSPRGSDNVLVSEQTKDLLERLKKNEPTATLKELDAIPRAKSQRGPVFPLALQGKVDQGEAVVEFFIDDDGTALLPRVVSATAEEFGYAAVQAVSQWKFERPLKGGKAVIVRAEVPISFKLK